jgi:hypothetical protein
MDKCPRLLPVSTPNISSTAGNPLLASIAVQAGTATVTDSRTNLWARDRVGFLSGSNMRVEMWYATDTAPIACVTVHHSAAGLARATVSEWSGVAARTTGNPLDLVGGAINPLWAPLRAREILRLFGAR